MGAACCVASRDKTTRNSSSNEFLHRNICYSPTWSFRWDHHRGRVAGEDTTLTWVSDATVRNDGADNKYESAYTSEDGSPESFAGVAWKKPSISGVARNKCVSLTDHSASRNISMDTNSEQVKEPSEFHELPSPSPAKSLSSTPLTLSPLSSQNRLPPASSTPLRWSCHSSGHQLLKQASDSQAGFKSLSSSSMLEERQVSPPWNDPARDSHAASSDGWSVPVFSDSMTPSRGRWSFDSGSFGFNREKITRCGSEISSASVDSQACAVCSKLLSDKSSWRSQVVAILVCGHAYHAECLERITPEVKKYDPSCPLCILGEKQTLKLSEKALKSELEENGNHRKIFRLGSSSSMKSSFGKPFLKRHFSIGSRGSRMLSDNHPTRKKGFFWAKSSKT